MPFAGKALILGRKGPESIATNLDRDRVRAAIIWRPHIQYSRHSTKTEENTEDGCKITQKAHFEPKPEDK